MFNFFQFSFVVRAWFRVIVPVLALPIKNILNFLTCGGGHDTSKALQTNNELDVSYTQARDRGFLLGLGTYNILQNPLYKEAFDISDQFALTHSRVKSIRNFTAQDSVRDVLNPVSSAGDDEL